MRKKVILFVAAALLASQAVAAQGGAGNVPEPEKAAKKSKNPFKSKRFWIETAVVVGTATLDVESTQYAFRRCWNCTEANPIFGARRPGRARMYLVGGAVVAGQRLLMARFWDKREVRAVSTVATVLHGGLHTAAAISNFHTPYTPRPQPQVCPAAGAGCVLKEQP